ncbi:hypothetical protein PR001_g18673 [Phytophthora rubi]|uniref:Apple domain-containing protein n=1 Tax=Phytophthora rubi TaxID=129364 RepID=A0A6A3K9T4_9STRA|nr:hypothetical protein PR002_g19135 [Phytophthora rubi]KAE9000864.1 hypothetical protein PR001_g18673 [Phytophthora rubi]
MQFFTALVLSLSTIATSALGALEECVIEDGFDYVGNDLFGVASVDASDCCHQCQKHADAGCRAYSWTDYQGGTCWLKRGRGSVAVDVNVKSGTISSFRFTNTCVLEHGIDYEGRDLADVKASDAGDCCSICEQFPGCRAFTFTTYNGGTCWLKSGKGNMVVDPTVISSSPYIEQPTCGLEFDIDYVGNNIGSARAAEAKQCCSLCEAFGGCRAFTWSDYQGGTCWFKNRKDAVSWELGAQSGQVFSNPAAPSCALEFYVEYTGKDIGNVSSDSPYGCCSACMKTVGCGAFSWSDAGGGVCYLKSTRGNVQDSDNFFSSVV